MLKEYTLKVVVQIGGPSEEDCDEKLAIYMQEPVPKIIENYEITHEEVVEVEREA